MSFEELWDIVKEQKVLPYTAIVQVPSIISMDTKKMLSRKTPEQLTAIVAAAIEEVNHGSIAPIDELIKKRL